MIGDDKMSKLFVVSDIHGFCTELKEALNKAGFDEANEDHWLITCGDHFDRGEQPYEVMKYLINLPRKILIRGNHEQLFEDMCHRGYAEMYDISNGTAQTANLLGNVKELQGDWSEIYDNAMRRVQPFFNRMLNYFETQNYIFVHSWIPTLPGENWDGKPWYTKNRFDVFNPNWREANQVEWDDAMWGNPFKQAEQGLNQTGKTIVFGHWHCSTGWVKEKSISEFGDDAIWEPYYGNGYIAIDRCTAHTRKVNVLVLEDEFFN